MRIGHGTEGGCGTRHTLYQANHVAALTVLGANGDVAGQGEVTLGEVGVGAATQLVNKEVVLQTCHKSTDGVVLGGDALGHKDGVGGGIVADVAQAIGFTRTLVARPVEAHGRGGEVCGVDIEIDGALADFAGDDTDAGEGESAFGRGRGNSAESKSCAIRHRFGGLLKVDAMLASALYAANGNECADIGRVGHIAVMGFHVDAHRGIENQHRVVGLAVDGWEDGISGHTIARGETQVIVSVDENAGIARSGGAYGGEVPAEGQFVGRVVGAIALAGGEVLAVRQVIGSTFGDEGGGGIGRRGVGSTADRTDSDVILRRRTQAGEGAACGGERGGYLGRGVAADHVFNIVSHRGADGRGGDGEVGGGASNVGGGNSLRIEATCIGQGLDTEVGDQSRAGTALGTRVAADAGLVLERACRTCGIGVALVGGIDGTATQYADDQVVGTVVVEGGGEVDVAPASGHGLGLKTGINQREVRHGNPIGVRSRDGAGAVSHVDRDGRSSETGLHTGAIEGDGVDGGTGGEVDIVGLVDGLGPARYLIVEERGHGIARCAGTDGLGNWRLGRGAGGAEEECGREGQEPRGGFQGVLCVFHIVYVFVSKRINAPQSGENKMQRYTFLSAWQRQFKLNILKKAESEEGGGRGTVGER